MYKININTRKRSFTLSHTRRMIKISPIKRSINIASQGKRGLQGPIGPQGPPGVSMPIGGIKNQALVKKSNLDYDYDWRTLDAVDKNYIQNFNATNFLTITHNLNKYPAVTIHDSAGDEVVGEIVHVNTNKLSARFSAPFSGRITCN